jgi:hypothetical protein
MKSFVRIFIGLFLLTLWAVSGCRKDDLYQTFQNPPAEARPFVRWWWNGNCLTEQEIVRELDILKKAGIGGIEINPIAMPEEVTHTGETCLSWGSPEWAHMVKFAAAEAKARGMVTDIIMGTGWPFGGKFLSQEEQIKGVVLNRLEVNGPTNTTLNVHDHIKLLKMGVEYKPNSTSPVPKPQIVFIKLVPSPLTHLQQVVDVTGQCDQHGDLTIKLPAGRFTLAIGTLHTGIAFRQVTNGAPGADGPCLDHYNAAAVTKYCDRLAHALEPVLGSNLGQAIRALFVDSIELSGSNWTNDFREEFQARNGYDLMPYLPFVIYEDAYKGFEWTFTANPALADTISRVRYDYSRTLVEMFLDRFLKTYHTWCHEHGTLSRYQAYGMPWLMGIAEGYMIPDIPESNNWLFSRDAYAHGYNVWNKYTSSGGHLAGRKIISCEAMTNTRGVFQTSLDMIKQADDLNFIMGLNHSVLHGFNYSPPQAGFPGWVRYGAYFSEQNPWWPYFPYWVEYNARLSSLFQVAKPVVQIAILAPEADTWSSSGLVRTPFQTKPWYTHRLWEAMSQNGFTADYVGEKVVQQADTKDGRLTYGPITYEVLVLSHVETLLPETARAIAEFAKAGGKLVFIGVQPHRSPSLISSSEHDSMVQESMALTRSSQHVLLMDEPLPEHLLDWTTTLMNKLAVPSSINIANPDPDVYQIQYRFNDQDLFFFVNRNPLAGRTVQASFRVAASSAWRWRPESGERYMLPWKKSDNRLAVELQPSESCLIVFDTARNGMQAQPARLKSEKELLITSHWECEFLPIHSEPFQRNWHSLLDFKDSTDPLVNSFAGTVVYRTMIDLDDATFNRLDLGQVFGVSEASLNGKTLGIRWWGRPVFDIGAELHPGKNELVVRVTPVLLNHMRSLHENATAQVWTAQQQPVSAGLIGPVKILRAVE